MSIPTNEYTETFLAPLRGNLAILVLHDVEAKFAVGRLILNCARLRPADTLLLDVDGFYCTNMDRLVEDGRSVGEAQVLLLSEKDFDMNALLALLTSKRRLLIIDGLNSLHSLSENRHASHQLAIILKILSYNARMNRSWAIATAYRPELGGKPGTNQRSLMALGNFVVDTYYRDGSLRLKAGFNGVWPNDELEV